MKKLLLLSALLCTLNLSAQVGEVVTDIYGKFYVTVDVGNGYFVVVDMYGSIQHTNLNRDITYYSDFYDYEAGKVKSACGVPFQYYSDFYSYENGKIKKIGNVTFSYYSDFYNYENGKIKMIGNVPFSYYSDFYNYENGKIKKIGSMEFKYCSDFYEYETGKLKKLGDQNYTYYSSFDSNSHVGRLKSGAPSFEYNGIYVQVVSEFQSQRRGHRHGRR